MYVNESGFEMLIKSWLNQSWFAYSSKYHQCYHFLMSYTNSIIFLKFLYPKIAQKDIILLQYSLCEYKNIDTCR